MLRFIFFCLMIYVLYKLIFDLIIPVSKATAQVREKMKAMQQQQANQQATQNNSPAQKVSKKADNTVTDAEYIDYEEVKE